MKLVLASASPRRHNLLRSLFDTFEIRPVEAREDPLPGETPRQTALRLAQIKALLASPKGDELAIAADTVVALNGLSLGKPSSAEEARQMLKALRGREHTVYTGVAIATAERALWSSVVETLVTMRAYSDAEIDAYVASGSPMDKAGAYGVQDTPFSPVAQYAGCYLNVVGLPLCEVVRGLKALGFTGAQGLSWTAIEPLCPTCTQRRQAGEVL